MIKTSLFAAEERETKLDKLGDILQKLDEHVNFQKLAEKVDIAAPRPSRLRGGRPPFPTELMVRIIVIQQLYNLSDEQLEFQLLDRLSFQRFTGLRESSQIPDRTTFWTFRERLVAANASETLFDAVQLQLDQHGYIARGGQMVDASLVPVPKQQLDKKEKSLIKSKALPAEWKPSKRRQKDSDATWTKKHGKSYYGYKVSANVDNQYKLIRKIKVSTASEHDTRHLEDVLDPMNTSKDLYADKGYIDQTREEKLKQQGLRVHIQRKGTKNKPLSECQKNRNNRISKVRVRVEHAFAGIEQMGGKKIRTIGLARATLQLNLKTACYNLKRLCSLKSCNIKSSFAF